MTEGLLDRYASFLWGELARVHLHTEWWATRGMGPMYSESFVKVGRTSAAHGARLISPMHHPCSSCVWTFPNMPVKSH